ncbi:MAG TPA: rhodanese-like domain-containing protein [Dehalococcoidia bacterium]|jgi:rhodanese-related sulfurtransferase|nr:rhodanese-like domain-containing protein [Dehalococcoidia bacterium]
MRRVDKIELQQLIAAGATVIEVLPAEEYAEAHLPGAINISLKSFSEDALAQVDRSAPVIVYCQDWL